MSDINAGTHEIIEIKPSEILSRVRNLKDEGCRIVQVCATATGDGYEILYSFDREKTMISYRIKVAEGEKVESITKQYWSAFIYENEMHDLFGINFLHNELDYGGNFFKVSEKAPWRNKQEEEGRE